MSANSTLDKISYSNSNTNLPLKEKLLTPKLKSSNFIISQTSNSQQLHLNRKRKTSICDTTSSNKNNKTLNDTYFLLNDSIKQKTKLNTTSNTKNVQKTDQNNQSTQLHLENGSIKSNNDSDTKKTYCIDNSFDNSLNLLQQKTLNNFFKIEKL